MVFQIARTCVGSSNTARKLSSVNASASVTPNPQLVTNARNAIPDSGTITLMNSQNPSSPTAAHFHLPSGNSRMRPALPLIVAYRRAFCSSLRCSRTSGTVSATMQIATAAIKWYEGVPSLLVSLYR